MTEITIYTDGGSRGNPGPAALGAVIYKEINLLHKIGKKLGVTTNNVAEYSAILEALSWVAENRELIGEFSGINFRMDSLLACQQLKGIFKVKQSHLQSLFLAIRQKERELGKKMTYTQGKK